MTNTVFRFFKLDIFSISYQQAVVVEHRDFPNTEISSLKMSLQGEIENIFDKVSTPLRAPKTSQIVALSCHNRFRASTQDDLRLSNEFILIRYF
jgi:hypothetical protein